MKKGVLNLIATSYKDQRFTQRTKKLEHKPKKQVVQGLLAVAIQITFSNTFRLFIVSSIVIGSTPLDKKTMPIRLRIEQSINDHWYHQLKKSKKNFLIRLAYGHSNTSRWNWLVYAMWHTLQFFCNGCWQSDPQFNWQ